MQDNSLSDLLSPLRRHANDNPDRGALSHTGVLCAVTSLLPPAPIRPSRLLLSRRASRPEAPAKSGPVYSTKTYGLLQRNTLARDTLVPRAVHPFELCSRGFLYIEVLTIALTCTPL